MQITKSQEVAQNGLLKRAIAKFMEERGRDLCLVMYDLLRIYDSIFVIQLYTTQVLYK